MNAPYCTQGCHCAHLNALTFLQVPGQAQARQLEWADLAAFPYFNAVLKESMRLHTAAAVGTFR
eukprot:1143694-Pelagomonas_calceolata.AAC.5